MPRSGIVRSARGARLYDLASSIRTSEVRIRAADGALTACSARGAELSLSRDRSGCWTVRYGNPETGAEATVRSHEPGWRDVQRAMEERQVDPYLRDVWQAFLGPGSAPADL